MKTYELYLIQEDIAKAYFGREYLFLIYLLDFQNLGPFRRKKCYISK